VPADEAFDVAYKEALKGVRDRLDEEEAFAVNWTLDGLEAQDNPPSVDMAQLGKYAGSYGPRALRFENGKLVYQRAPNPPMVMIPMSATLFRFAEIDYFRLEVVLDDAGNPTAIVGRYDNGMMDRSSRDPDKMSAETD